ncbi:tetratricopeptide repeat protein [Saccharicrinis sp. FJH62]|uniref:tetratricopeptide repeat protein n=1 Tax=Saccharicrinis sp. FJH62 TaxID=3344657 RepID=UPI0035D4EC3C
MKTKVFTTLALLAFTMTMIAQKGVDDGSKYGHGEDSVRCLSNLSLFHEYAKQKNYKDAVEPWTICYNECPAASIYIYTDGENIIEWQIKKAQSSEDKDQYITSLMQLYDQRIKYYGNYSKYPEAYIQGKKALSYYEYYGNTTEGLKQSMDNFESAITGLKKNFTSSTASTLLSCLSKYIGLNFVLYDRGEITGEKLIANYQEIQSDLDNIQKATKKYDSTVNQLRDYAEEKFAESGVADCKTLESMYASRVEEEKSNKEELEKILNTFDKSDCTESETYFKAAEYVFDIEPSAIGAVALARMYINPSHEDIDKAMEYLKQAVSLETDNDKKADYLYLMANIEFTKKKDYPIARSYALKAIAARPNWGDPYILIGQMYAASAQAQQLGSKDIENRAGYWAAVDKFKKAKQIDPSSADEANKYIKIYSQYFPGTEEIFMQEGFELNKPYHVGGWINETTICTPKD